MIALQRHISVVDSSALSYAGYILFLVAMHGYQRSTMTLEYSKIAFMDLVQALLAHFSLSLLFRSGSNT